MTEKLFWAPRAWIDSRWQEGVVLSVNSAGCWSEITPGIMTPPAAANVLAGPAIPALVNAHSHAFQRAFAGLAERRDTDSDDFWSWRDRMYGVALRITPQQLRAVAAQLYVELLRGGYTQVCEFHYLHHAPDGSTYDDPATMSWALADGAADVGIGLKVLPVLYERAGFTASALRDDQRRFRSTSALVHKLFEAITTAHRPLLNAGVAVHSLRAAGSDSIIDLMRRIDADAVPIHIHVAEQMREVEECIAANGARPIELLCRKLRPDARWQLVHATHAMSGEIEAVAASGAGIVICPTTEANLGDGLPDLPRWLASGAPISLGSDSQMSRSWIEELRWLEYAQRLVRHERNVAAAPGAGQSSTAARLFDTVVSGGGHAAGFADWGLKVGARADALVLNTQAPGLLGIPSSHALDALVFASDSPSFREVYIVGNRVMVDGKHAQEAVISERFSEVMLTLWGT
jgi:formimidoylglutamate deiminase